VKRRNKRCGDQKWGQSPALTGQIVAGFLPRMRPLERVDYYKRAENGRSRSAQLKGGIHLTSQLLDSAARLLLDCDVACQGFRRHGLIYLVLRPLYSALNSIAIGHFDHGNVLYDLLRRRENFWALAAVRGP
jgi:hypothetical protein